MSGSAGGNRIPREAVQATVNDYIDKVLSKYPGFKSAKITGSYNTSKKSDFGDIDLIVQIDGEDKKLIKQDLAKFFTSFPDSIIVPFKSEKYSGKKFMNTGELVTILYPIIGFEDQYAQIDNIISVSEEESVFKNSFLDYPAEIQGLLLGLAKVICLEENPKDIFKRLGITNVPELEENQEYEFNLSSSGLTLRIVTLDNFKETDRTEVWKTSNWGKIKLLFQNYNIDSDFPTLLSDLSKKLTNSRSKTRVKGIFKSMVSIKSGEVGTAKGDNKAKAIQSVDSLLENKLCKGLVESLITPFLIEDQETTGKTLIKFSPDETVALYPGKFKPPHKGHLDVVNQLTQIADKVYVIISPKTHEGITSNQSLAIWENLYAPLILDKSKVTFLIARISPIGDTYDIIEANPETNFIAAYGKDEVGRYQSKFKSDKVNIYNAGEIEGVNSTKLRQALFSQGDITPYIPEEVSSVKYLETLGLLLHENIEEYKNKTSLNPSVFSDLEIKPKVKDALLKIANRFWDSLDLDIKYEDILLLGSSANYNWTPYSDIDLHILVDFDQFEDPEIAKKYFDSAKSRFNDAHDLKIKKNDIEVYIQNSKEPNASVGVYSLLNNKWLQEPTYEKIEIPDKDIENKAKPYKQQIDKIINTKPTPKNYDSLVDKIDKLQEKIKKFRQTGLQDEGEYSIENLAFKNLRNTKYIEKLFNFKNEITDKILSINEIFNQPVDSYSFSSENGEQYSFTTENNEIYTVEILPASENRIFIDFGVQIPDDIDYSTTNKGDLYKVMSTIIAITKDYIDRHPEVEIISWQSIGKTGETKIGDTQRDKLYKLILKRQGGLKDDDIVFKNGEWWAYLKGYDTVFEGYAVRYTDAPLETFTYKDLLAVGSHATSQLSPANLVFSNHFLDRVKERGITKQELIDFFTHLNQNPEAKKKLFSKLQNYDDELLATDSKTSINIPLAKKGGKDIKAITVMRKKGFRPNNPNDPHIVFEDKKDFFGLNEYARELATDLTEADPKTGTGKKPKGSGRRLYTDENPKDTVSIKFKTKEDIAATLNKASFKSKSHARQSQIINLIHQRVRAAYQNAKDPEVKKRLKRALEYITKRKETSKKKTKRLQKLTEANNIKTSKAQYAVKILVLDSMDKFGTQDYLPYIKMLTQYMIDNGLNINPLPKLIFIDNDVENANNILGRTAHYDPNNKCITLFTYGRHPKDVLRSYAHEMIHHLQNLENRIVNVKTFNINEDDYLKELEREAYEKGNLMFRGWENNLKSQND